MLRLIRGNRNHAIGSNARNQRTGVPIGTTKGVYVRKRCRCQDDQVCVDFIEVRMCLYCSLDDPNYEKTLGTIYTDNR